MTFIQCFPYQSTDYAAVFIVNTPADDHSGLSHLAEHMCFRGSDDYPADHELFVVNSALPASINASTQQGVTYFYVTAQDLSLFIQLIDYLYAGLIQTQYTDSGFHAERDGVLVSELTLLEKDKGYVRDASIRRADNAALAYKHPGGFSDLVGNITNEQLTAYKNKWYRPDRITALFSGPHIKLHRLVNDVINQRKSKTFACSQRPMQKCQRKAKQAPNGVNSQQLTVSTWWLPLAYLTDLKQHENMLKQAVMLKGELYIDDQINDRGFFALRFIHRANDKAHEFIVSLLQQFAISAKEFVFSDDKLPADVQRLIQQHYRSQRQANKPVQPLAFYLDTAYQSQYVPFTSTTLATPRSNNNPYPSAIAKQHQELLSLSHLPQLPALLTAIAEQTCVDSPFCQRNGHWVYRVDKDKLELLKQYLITPAFWYPRTNGECYAMGIARHKQRVYVYGAQDMYAHTRKMWCQQIFDADTCCN